MVRGGAPSLSASARRALPFIERGVRAGMSSTALQTVLREGGMGVRRTDLLDTIRYLKGVERRSNAIASVRRDLTPDPQRFPIARTNIRRSFSYRVRVEGFDGDTGERTSKLIIVSSDTVLSRAEVESEATSVIEEGRANYVFEVDRAVLVQALRRA